MKSDKLDDKDDWEGADKRKHRLGKSRKHSSAEETEERDASGKRKSSGDRDERKKSGGSSRAWSGDEDDYDIRREPRTKIVKKSQEERTEKKSSIGYRERDSESSKKVGAEESERNSSRKTSTKPSSHENSQGKSRSKADNPAEGESNKTKDRDSRYSERKENRREKGHVSHEQERSSRRWDETDSARKAEDSSYADKADLRSGKDHKRGSSRERNLDTRVESVESKSRGIDSKGERGGRSRNRDERKVDLERSKSKGRSEAYEEPAAREEKSEDGDDDKKRRPREDESSAHRPSSRLHERLSSRDWEGSKDSWKKRHQSRHDKESKDVDGDFDYEREWDSQKREQERMDNEKLHGRSGYRKDRSRPAEGAKTSSNFGNTNENSDTIEIKSKSLEYGRDESGHPFAGRRNESGSHHDFTPGSSDDEWGYMREDRSRTSDIYGPNNDKQDRYSHDDLAMLDRNGLNSGRNSYDIQGDRGRGQKDGMNSVRSGAGQTSSTGTQPSFGNNQGSGSLNRAGPQGGAKAGGRLVRGGRGRVTGRDVQRAGIPLPMMGPPFGHMGLPTGPMQPIGPNMSPAPGPPISPSVFIPPFQAPLVWSPARGVDMNMLVVPPGLAPVPQPGPSGPRFPPNMGTGPNPAMYFNQPGPGRGVSPGMPGPGFNSTGPTGPGMPHDKAAGGWGPPRTSGPPGKAPSRGEQNDYSQNFVDTGMRPQNFIRELELTSTVEDYPKLRELIQKKDDIVAKSATPPMYFKCDLREFGLSSEFFGTKFDVILVDPPWEEYVHRAPGVADHMEYWTFEEIQNLKIEAIADTPSFIFLWVGDGVGLEQGRACLKKWGFRRCEDICWVKTNKSNATPGLRHDSHTLFQHSKEHCLMGIKGTVRRSTDGHIIHANIDTDIVIAEEPPYGSTKKPEDLYRIIEHFSLGRRRLELFGEDHNIRSGWLTVGKGLSSSNFNTEAYVRNFSDKDGKVWQGGGGRNPPPDAPHLVLTTPEIEGLRPKSPPAKTQQQQQQQSTSIQTTATSTNKRPAVNSPQNTNPMGLLGLNQESSSSNPPTPMPWASPMAGAKGGPPEAGNAGPDDKFTDGYGFNASCGQPNGDHPEFEPHRAVNL